MSSCSSPTGLLWLNLWEIWTWGVHLCDPRWQGWDWALSRVLHGEEWVILFLLYLIKHAWNAVLSYIDGLWLVSAVNPNTCSSTGSERLARFFNKKVTTLPAGSPCNDFKGYCDVFMKCRLVDADGPLARLKKAIFNPELYENIAEWIVVCIVILTEEWVCCIVLIVVDFGLFSRLTGGQFYWWESLSSCSWPASLRSAVCILQAVIPNFPLPNHFQVSPEIPKERGWP